MQDDLITKAPGMTFTDLRDKPRPTPRVIHALGRPKYYYRIWKLANQSLIEGNIKWGFHDRLRPLPVEKVQSKWDKDHGQRASRGALGSVKLSEDVLPTSKVVFWPKVRKKTAFH